MTQLIFGTVRRPLFWLGLCFLIAVALGLLLPTGLALPCALGLVFPILWLSQASKRRFLPLLVVSAVLGLGTVFLHQSLLSARLAPLLVPEQRLIVTMTVEESVERGAYRRYTGRAILFDQLHTTEAQVSVTGFVEILLSPGETLYCEARVPADTVPPTLLTAEPVSLFLSQVLSHDAQPPPYPIRAKLIRWRSFLSSQIDSFAPGETGAVLSAMLTGDQTKLSPELNAAFRRSGLSHLLVVSGMHLVILCSMLSLLLAPLPMRPRALILLVFCWGFAFLTGAGNSILRAAVMMTLAQIGPLLGRENDTLTSLSVAGVLMAAQNPAALLTASFGLSFGAVAGLALLQKPIEQFLIGKSSSFLRRRLCANLAAGLAAQVGAAPVLLSTFGLFPLLGILANLLVVELIGPLMALGLLALVCSFMAYPLASFLFSAAQGLALLLIQTARGFSSLLFAQIGISARWQAVGLLGLFLVCVWLLAHRPGKHAVRMALLGWCAVFLSVSVVSTVLSRPFSSVLIAESGMAAVVQKGRAVIFGSPADLWEATRFSDAMIRLGVRRIDGVLLLDGDSAKLPLVTLLDRFEGERRIAATDLPTTRRFCDAAGLTLCQPPQSAPLFDGATISREQNGWLISFSDAVLLKSSSNCVIIGTYRRAMPLDETILHGRVRLEETDDSAK